MFNDWESFRLLLHQLKQDLPEHFRVEVLAVNDGSNDEPQTSLWKEAGLSCRILHLTRNVGHQKAIAAGLAYANEHLQADMVVVMDSDGEDRPADIITLIDASAAKPNQIIFAQRQKRWEGPVFVFFYRIYKLIFKLLTGKFINFGNFCLIPFSLLKRVVHVSEIWNHFSGGIIKSRIKYSGVPTIKGKRLHGTSKMNFTSLVFHGLSAVAVHADTMAVRLVVASFILICLSILSILTVSFFKFFTPYASPGWATTVVTGFTSVIMQSFLISLLLLFIVMIYRTQRMFIPALDYKDFVDSVEEIHTA